jgi:hypothetical protein
MEGKISRRELEGVASLFISPNNGGSYSSKRQSDNMVPEDDAESSHIQVEEHLNIKRKMAYPSTPEGQEELKKYILKLIKEDYNITKIELNKSSNFSTQNKRALQEEDIVVFIKDG